MTPSSRIVEEIREAILRADDAYESDKNVSDAYTLYAQAALKVICERLRDAPPLLHALVSEEILGKTTCSTQAVLLAIASYLENDVG